MVVFRNCILFRLKNLTHLLVRAFSPVWMLFSNALLASRKREILHGIYTVYDASPPMTHVYIAIVVVVNRERDGAKILTAHGVHTQYVTCYVFARTGARRWSGCICRGGCGDLIGNRRFVVCTRPDRPKARARAREYVTILFDKRYGFSSSPHARGP